LRHAGVGKWWEDTSITGIGDVHEPSGWSGLYNLNAGDRYQNCTAARVYSSAYMKDAQPAATDKAWFNDEVCTETLQRWVRAYLHLYSLAEQRATDLRQSKMICILEDDDLILGFISCLKKTIVLCTVARS
jgi:hypothetical protein